MKIPLVIRDDGTAYRLTLHKKCPDAPRLGIKEDGFVLDSVSQRRQGNELADWLQHEEFRKPPELDYFTKLRLDLICEATRAHSNHEANLAILCSRAATAIRCIGEERDELKKHIAAWEARNPGMLSVKSQYDTPEHAKERRELAQMLARWLDQSGPSFWIERQTISRIWRALVHP